MTDINIKTDVFKIVGDLSRFSFPAYKWFGNVKTTRKNDFL